MVARNSYLHKRRKELGQSVALGFVFIAVFAGVIGFLVFQDVKMYQKRSDLSREIEKKKTQIAQLEFQNAQLQATVETSAGKEYQEKVLRDQGLYKKPGEQVVTVLPPANSQQVQTQQSKTHWWSSLQSLYNAIIGK